MYVSDKFLRKSSYLSRFIESVQNIIDKYDNKEEGISDSYQEDKLEYIKNKLNEIEESILNYNQYKELAKDKAIEINIKKLEKLYENIIK